MNPCFGVALENENVVKQSGVGEEGAIPGFYKQIDLRIGKILPQQPKRRQGHDIIADTFVADDEYLLAVGDIKLAPRAMRQAKRS